MDDLAALHAQLAGVNKNLGDRLERIEAALLGDDELGLDGMVRKLRRLDADNAQSALTHEAMETRRREGDARLHERIDALEGKWKLAVGIAVGASVGSAGGAAWLVQAFT